MESSTVMGAQQLRARKMGTVGAGVEKWSHLSGIAAAQLSSAPLSLFLPENEEDDDWGKNISLLLFYFSTINNMIICFLQHCHV